ncbi:MAG: ABC transporter ATP-binding protein [Amphiplicatus sp.]
MRGTDSKPAVDPALVWLFGVSNRRWGAIARVLLLSALTTAIALAQPLLTKFLIDDGLAARRADIVVTYSGILFAAAISAALLGALNRYHYIRLSSGVLFDIREGVYRHLQKLSPSFYARFGRGDVMTRIDGDIAEVQRFSTDGLFSLVNSVFALGGALIMLIALNWRLTLLAFILLPAQVLLLRYFRPKVESQNRAVRDRTGDLTEFFSESLSSMKLIQSTGSEAREAVRLRVLNQAFLKDLLRLQLTSYYVSAAPSLMTTAGVSIVFIVGGLSVVSGEMTLGVLIAFSAYLGRATGPAQSLLGLYMAYQRARVSLDRVWELASVKPAVTERVDAIDIPHGAAGRIQFDNVAFRYKDRNTSVLKNINCVFPAGEKIAIKGASGAGKSTLIDLLQRLYDPDLGRIFIDGVDVTLFKLRALRRAIGVVSQEPTFFRASIEENIRFGSPEANLEDIMLAARTAGLESFIASLPDGYQTQVGTAGSALSGGQRQRLAIARAILLDPLILVLDEATSDIDQETESEIIGMIDRLFSNRTRILISHRQKFLDQCDRAFDLRAGVATLIRPMLEDASERCAC